MKSFVVTFLQVLINMCLVIVTNLKAPLFLGAIVGLIVLSFTTPAEAAVVQSGTVISTVDVTAMAILFTVLPLGVITIIAKVNHTSVAVTVTDIEVKESISLVTSRKEVTTWVARKQAQQVLIGYEHHEQYLDAVHTLALIYQEESPLDRLRLQQVIAALGVK